MREAGTQVFKRNKYKAVKTGDGRYLITPEGEVYSLYFRNRMVDKLRQVPKKLKAVDNSRGYLVVRLPVAKNKFKTQPIHVLVLTAFVGPKPPGMVCGHKDGDPHNNNIANLYWISQKQNQDDRRRHGRLLVGSQVATAKLSESAALDILRRKIAGEKTRTLSREYNISYKTIQLIHRRKYWKHLSV